MAIWMGLNGGIRIARTATEQIYANISVADVDAGIKRFGLDKPVSNLFSTGDRVEIWMYPEDCITNRSVCTHE